MKTFYTVEPAADGEVREEGGGEGGVGSLRSVVRVSIYLYE